MFYRYRQNNSGGSFGLPAINVIVEADSPLEADKRAGYEAGLYFDSEDDCPCCGDRWYTASEWDATEEVPDASEWDFSWSTDKIPTVAIYYANGEVETR